MKLYATPLSHFSRKVRILLDLYSLPYEFIDVGNVAEGPREKFAGNPLSSVPVLVDGDDWVIDSDQIAEYLVTRFDSSDRYRVVSRSLFDRNVRSVLNGIMSDEVTVILARRTGVPTEQYSYFSDALEAIGDGLSWLEARAADFSPDRPGYREFHLVCAWEHISHYDLVPLAFPKLKSIVTRVLEAEKVRQTSPFILKPRSSPGSKPT